MRLSLKLAIIAGVLALAVPAAAWATQPAEPGHGHGKANGPSGSKYSPENPPPPGPKAPLPEQAKAYGVYCRGESKKHVEGTPGTPFSACVKAHAKAAIHPNMSPGRACKGTSGKHVKGEKGTPHSRCVAGVVEQRKKEREEAAAAA